MADALRETPNAETRPRVWSAGVVENNRYMPPPVDADGQTWVRTSAIILASPEECYRLWRDLSSAPRWQEFIKEVRVTGEKTSHWVMEADGKTMEWDSEIMQDEPGKRIAWRSIGGQSQNAGEVIFESAPGGRGTLVTVLQEFGMGKLAAAAATISSRNPKQAVIENVRHFKALIEAGEIPRTEGQPHGPRNTSAKMKASVYGENITVPPGFDELERKAS
jgi:uncharacterized membrane protein